MKATCSSPPILLLHWLCKMAENASDQPEYSHMYPCVSLTTIFIIRPRLYQFVSV